MTASLRASLALSILLGALGAVVACSSQTIPSYCTGIPTGGCPGGGPTDCVDPTCAAIYSHTPDCTWNFVVSCPNYVPPVDAASSASDGGASDAAPPHDATVLLPEGAAGGPGCTELEDPDCPLATGAACGLACCGCMDLYVCVDGGWNHWGTCGEAGLPVASPSP